MATNEEFLSTIKEGCIQGWRDHAVLASISAAQAILESNWGKSTLALQANNLFGIKGEYNGESLTVETKEFINKVFKIVDATFRKYPSWSESITDHSAFFTSTDWRKNNYSKVVGETDYKKAAQALSDVGYATDPDYPAKLIKLIETYDLHQWDEVKEETEMGITYDHTTINYSGSVTSKKYIVWHDTGVKGQTAAGNANYFRSVDRQSSANYFIDKIAIVEVVDPNLVAWHCGDGAGKYGITNANSIGIELCPEADGTIHADTIANAIWLGKKLMKDFGISYDNNVRHYDASRKNCPQYLNTDGKWTKWYAFKAQLAPTATVTTATETVTAPVRNPVSYNATIASGGYSIDSKPWGEPGAEYWGSTDEQIGKVFYFYEENYSGEYANGMGLGWVDKRALEKEKVVVASTLYLPNGQNWVVYPENGPYEVGEVISVEGKEGSWYTILGGREDDKVVIDLQTIGRKALLFEPDKGATITKTYA